MEKTEQQNHAEKENQSSSSAVELTNKPYFIVKQEKVKQNFPIAPPTPNTQKIRSLTAVYEDTEHSHSVGILHSF
jgi:hypothetical protein